MKTTKYIIIAGCYRSGTTALFNLVRLCLKHLNQEYDAYFWEGKTKGKKEYQLLKTHTFSPGLAKKAHKVFVGHRKMIDVRKSMMELNKFNINRDFANAADLKNLKFAMGDSMLWMQSADYVQNFEVLVNDPGMLIFGILRALEIPSSMETVEAVMKEFKELRAPKEGVDRTTLLTETHRKFI